MTPLAYAKWGGILALVVLLCGTSYHLGGLASKAALEGVRAAQAQATVTGLQDQASQETKRAAVTEAAETEHDKDLEAIPLRVITRPVFVRSTASCPAAPTVPVAGEALGVDTGGGRVQPGPGVDIRPALEALKVKYETALADCRRLDADWPQREP